MRFLPSSLTIGVQDLRISGQYYYPNARSAGTASTSSFSPDYVYWYPLLVGRLPLSLAALAVNISAGAVGSFRMGVYSSEGGAPADLLSDFGEGTLNTTGVVDVAGSITLEPNTLYYVALTASVASTLYYRTTTALIALGQIVATPQNAATCYRLSRVYQALPSSASGCALSDASSFGMVKVS